jgi:hypothetical protein
MTTASRTLGPNLRIHGAEGGAEVLTEDVRMLFDEIRAENFPNPGKDMDI